MPIFSLTFGAFGDIVTAAQLALQIAKTLNDSSGASYEYQSLISELRSLATTLRAVEQTLSSTALDLSTQHALYSIINEVEICKSTLAGLQKQIKGYQSSLSEKASSNSWQISWRKIGWGLFKKADLISARERLSASRDTITLSLASISTNTVIRIEDSIQRNHTTIQLTLEQIKTRIDDIPNAIGFTAQNALRFEDVLGRHIILPIELCLKFENFNSIVQMRFIDAIGQRLVVRGQYDLTLNATGRIIDPSIWANVIKPGITIQMSVVLPPGVFKDFHQCPRCRARNRSISSNPWIECSQCDAKYQLLPQDTTHVDSQSLQTQLQDSFMLFTDGEKMDEMVSLAQSSLLGTFPWDAIEVGKDEPMLQSSLFPADKGKMTENSDYFELRDDGEDIYLDEDESADLNLAREMPFFRRIHILTHENDEEATSSIYVHPFKTLPGRFRWFSPCIYDCSQPLLHEPTLIKYLKAPIAKPSLTKINILIKESTSEEDYALALKPLEITASKYKEGVTLEDILDKLYYFLRGRITRQEWSKTSFQRRIAIAEDFAEPSHLNQETLEFEPPRGLKRIDCLQQQTFLERLLQEEDRPTFWHFYLVYGSSRLSNI